jgi:transposase-like protein
VATSKAEDFTVTERRDSEDEVFWREFLRSLKSLGCRVADHLRPTRRPGRRPTADVPKGGYQRCGVHYYCKLLALVSKSHKDRVAAALPTILARLARRPTTRSYSGRTIWSAGGSATAAWISLFEQLPWGTSTI